MPRLRSTCTALIASDFCALLASLFLAYLARDMTAALLSPLPYLSLIPAFALFLPLYGALGLYPGILRTPYDELKRLTIASSTGFLFVSFLFFLGRQGTVYSRSVLLLCWLAALVLVPACRFAVRRIFAQRDWWGYPVLLFAPKGGRASALQQFLVHPEQGLRIAASVLFDPDGRFPSVSSRLLLSSKRQMEDSMRDLQSRYKDAIALLVVDALSIEMRQTVILLASRYFRRVIVHMETSWIKQASLRVADAPCGLVLSMRQNLLDSNRRRMKRFLDILLCLAGSMVLLPLIPPIALCIRLDSRGPIFFRQRRVGLDGKPLDIIKFRTMVTGAEEALRQVLQEDLSLQEEWRAGQKLSRDPRLTRVGAFLRRTSLDELPQILNVLKGEMSLVGPRPIVEGEIARYGQDYELYKRVKPGMTGLWQVSGRNTVDYSRRVELDRHYVYNWSVWLDIYIIIRTFPVLWSGEGSY